jgi:hypothetical protein
MDTHFTTPRKNEGNDEATKLVVPQDQHSRLSLIQSKPLSWVRLHTTGWRCGLLNAAIVTLCVLLINIIVTIFAGNNAPVNSIDGSGTIFDGPCDAVRRRNVLYHLFINAASTLLLGASNYAMQILSAPTRKEIDAAHMRRLPLDIGILSLKNLRSITWSRAVLLLALGASSLPLHLL